MRARSGPGPGLDLARTLWPRSAEVQVQVRHTVTRTPRSGSRSGKKALDRTWTGLRTVYVGMAMAATAAAAAVGARDTTCLERRATGMFFFVFSFSILLIFFILATTITLIPLTTMTTTTTTQHVKMAMAAAAAAATGTRDATCLATGIFSAFFFLSWNN